MDLFLGYLKFWRKQNSESTVLAEINVSGRLNFRSNKKDSTTHQNPSVLCTPPFEEITLQTPSVLCTPPFEKSLFLVGAYFGWALISGWAFISANTVCPWDNINTSRQGHVKVGRGRGRSFSVPQSFSHAQAPPFSLFSVQISRNPEAMASWPHPSTHPCQPAYYGVKVL